MSTKKVHIFDSSTQASFVEEMANGMQPISELKKILEAKNMFRTGLVYGIGNGDSDEDPIVTFKFEDFSIRPNTLLPDYPVMIVSANISKSNHGGSRNDWYEYIKNNNLQNDPAFNGVNFTRAKNDILESVVMKHEFANAKKTLELKAEGDAQLEEANEKNLKHEEPANSIPNNISMTIPSSESFVIEIEKEEPEMTAGEVLDAMLQRRIEDTVIKEIAKKSLLNQGIDALQAQITALENQILILKTKVQFLIKK